jgi:hypothetical protein
MQKDKQLHLEIPLFTRVELQRWLKELLKKLSLLNQSMQIFSINQDFAQNDFNQLR